MTDQAIVLLSGGMDSVAVMHWTKARYAKPLALLFDYGQPNRDQELAIAGILASKAGVPRMAVVLTEALPRSRGILKSVEDHDGLEDGVSPAFVPGRNLLFITSASAHGSVKFPNGSFDVVIGSNGQDARRFPDCSHGALVKLAQALRHGVAREINVVAPFVDRTKEQILRSLDEAALEAVTRSWSCYRNRGPCGTCSACVLRAAAFAAVGIEDQCREIRLSGGDPGRDA